MEAEKGTYKDMNISESIRKVRRDMSEAIKEGIEATGAYGVQRLGDDTVMLYDAAGRCQGFVLVFPSAEALEEEGEDANA
jgi:hypothetical protein